MKGNRWSTEEKLALFQGAEKEGVVSTCRKYGIYASAYYQWKRRYDALGIQPVRYEVISRAEGAEQ